MMAIIFCLLGAFLATAGWFVYCGFFANPKVCYWPRLTICRSCGKHIFAWQAFSVRNYPVESIGPVPLAPSHTSGLVHGYCKDPEPIRLNLDVQIEKTSKSSAHVNVAGKDFDLYPKETLVVNIDHEEMNKLVQQKLGQPVPKTRLPFFPGDLA